MGAGARGAGARDAGTPSVCVQRPVKATKATHPAAITSVTAS